MTSIPRTLLDLGQILPEGALRKVVEAAERSNQLDPQAIEDVIARYPGHRGRRPLRRILSDYQWTPGANEGIEQDFQALLAQFRLPKPQVNVLVEGLLVDCSWPEHRFVVELDSKGWHKTWEAHERDRKRDAILLRAGIASLRITYRRIHQEGAEVAADVRAGLGLPTHPGPD
jgi:very-short-patch-repair endonuclease